MKQPLKLSDPQQAEVWAFIELFEIYYPHIYIDIDKRKIWAFINQPYMRQADISAQLDWFQDWVLSQNLAEEVVE